jgi:hypothetical protein
MHAKGCEKTKKNIWRFKGDFLPLQSLLRNIKKKSYEENVPTFPPQACQQARLPRKNGFRQRPPRAGFPPPPLPQETHCVGRRPLVVSEHNIPLNQSVTHHPGI